MVGATQAAAEFAQHGPAGRGVVQPATGGAGVGGKDRIKGGALEIPGGQPGGNAREFWLGHGQGSQPGGQMAAQPGAFQAKRPQRQMFPQAGRTGMER